MEKGSSLCRLGSPCPGTSEPTPVALAELRGLGGCSGPWGEGFVPPAILNHVKRVLKGLWLPQPSAVCPHPMLWEAPAGPSGGWCCCQWIFGSVVQKLNEHNVTSSVALPCWQLLEQLLKLWTQSFKSSCPNKVFASASPHCSHPAGAARKGVFFSKE